MRHAIFGGKLPFFSRRRRTPDPQFAPFQTSLSIGASEIVFTNANKIEFKLTHSEDGVTYDPVEDTDLLGGAAEVAGGVVND